MLLIIALTLISVASAQPTSIISNILQAQTVVTPAQPVSLIGGGGLSGEPKESTATQSITTGTPFLLIYNVTNPNNYTVTANYLWINFTRSDGGIINSGDIKVYITDGTQAISKITQGTSYLLVGISSTATSELFTLPSGLNVDVVIVWVVFNTPATYNYTVFMTQ